jgi:hypothetical protein
VNFDAVGSLWFFICLLCGRFAENFQPFFSHFYGMAVKHIRNLRGSLKGSKAMEVFTSERKKEREL